MNSADARLPRIWLPRIWLPSIVIPIMAHLLVAKPWLRTGASRSEAAAQLPGDDVLAAVQLQATRATTLRAPVADVWPWLVQMGFGRAGWYSLDRWDNGGEPSADRIVPGLQNLAVGDRIDDATGPFSFRVVELDPNRSLVLRATIHPITGRAVDPRHTDPQATGYAHAYLDLTWAFVLVDAGSGRTRLLVRVRYRHSRGLWVRAMVHGFELVDAVFNRSMLAGLRRRVEAAPARDPQPLSTTGQEPPILAAR